MKLPWNKPELNPQGPAEYDALVTKAFLGSGSGGGFPQVPLSPLPPLPISAPAPVVFNAIEKNAVYGAAFKRIMGEIAAEIAEKDKRIAELEAELKAEYDLRDF